MYRVLRLLKSKKRTLATELTPKQAKNLLLKHVNRLPQNSVKRTKISLTNRTRPETKPFGTDRCQSRFLCRFFMRNQPCRTKTQNHAERFIKIMPNEFCKSCRMSCKRRKKQKNFYICLTKKTPACQTSNARKTIDKLHRINI